MACSMPLEDQSLVAGENDYGKYCIYCANEEGDLKNGKEIFQAGVEFFMSAIPDANQELAERLVRKNMKSLKYWQKNPIDELNGAEATDSEFRENIQKLSSLA